MPTFIGIDHLAITVSDLERSSAFYEALWGMPPVTTMDGTALHRRIFRLPSGTVVGLTQHDDPGSGEFSPFVPGLDHVGFGVADRRELESWAHHLDSLGLVHSGLVEAPYGIALSVKDPDGVALEFYVAH